MQAAPVYRMPGPSALNGGSGIEASDFWSDLWNTVSPAIPGIVGGLTSLI